MNDCLIPSPAELMAEAQALTGLSDFGPSDWFLTPLGIEVSSINAEARLNDAGAVVQRGRLVSALANRLRLFEAIRKHPEIASVPVTVSAVLLGLSRSGTTMMHRLLNSVPGITAMKWWETHYPAPLEEEVPGQPVGRRAAAQALFDQMLATIPDLMSIPSDVARSCRRGNHRPRSEFHVHHARILPLDPELCEVARDGRPPARL